MDLRELALRLAMDGLGPDGQLIPFAIANGPDGMKNFNLLVDRSDEAMETGRRIVHQHASEVDEYVVCVDTYIRKDGERRDAVLIEIGARERPMAVVMAYLYARANGKAEVVGDPIEFEQRQNALTLPDPFLLDWGGITPDFWHDGDNRAVHAIHHELETEANVARTIRFLRARARWFARHLPDGSRQAAFIEDRGQNVTRATRDRFSRELANLELHYMTEIEK